MTIRVPGKPICVGFICHFCGCEFDDAAKNCIIGQTTASEIRVAHDCPCCGAEVITYVSRETVVDELTKSDYQEYISFMNDPKNIMNCDSCPENSHRKESNLPCGQQHCWVELHCD